MSRTVVKKRDQLGMHPATAAHKLKKKILFSMMGALELDNCWQCGEKITTVDDLSVEHKIPWLDSDDPVGLYFDLNNIAFSHLSCNVKQSRGKLNSERAKQIASLPRGEWTEDRKKQFGEIKAREYPSFVDEEGNQYPSGRNLSAFCRNYGLDISAMSRIVRGERQEHKGFRLVR